MKILDVNDALHAQNDAYLMPSEDRALTKERAMAFLIGILALFLAFGVAHLDGRFESACARSSISHYFYEPLAGTFLVMTLSFVGAFMIAYRGENRIDGWLATLGGIGGLLVAFFPTAGIGCAVGQMVDLRPSVIVTVSDLFDAGAKPWPDRFEIEAQTVRIGDAFTQRWHMIGAGCMFAVLFYFSAFVFTRINHERDRDPATGRIKAEKRLRNGVYLAMSLAMAIGIAMIVWQDAGWARGLSTHIASLLAVLPWGPDSFADVSRPVYHGEMLALAAFGTSWLVKGRFWKSPFKFLMQA